MNKRTCILSNAVSGASCSIDLDMDKSVVNNLRVWCHTYGTQMKHFIPEPLYTQILQDDIPRDMNIHSELGRGSDFIPVVENEVLGSQVDLQGPEGDSVELRLNIDDYAMPVDQREELFLEDKSNVAAGGALLVIQYPTPVGPSKKIPGSTTSETKTPETDTSATNTSNGKKGKKGKKEKKSKAKGLVFGIIFSMLIVAGGIFLLYTMINPVNQTKQALKNDDYEAVVSIYNEKIYGNAQYNTEIADAILEELDILLSTYQEDASTYETISQALETLTELKEGIYSQKAMEYLQIVQENNAANILFDKAEAFRESQDYLNAMLGYLQIPENTAIFGAAKQKYDLCKEIVLKGLQNPTTEDEYASYIDVLKRYLDEFSDDDFKTYYNQLMDEYATLTTNNAREAFLNDAKTAFENGNYEEAFEILNTGLVQMTGDQILQHTLSGYQETYAAQVIATAEALAEDAKYSEAIKFLQDAVAIYNCEELNELLVKLQALKTESLEDYTADQVEFLVYEDIISKEGEQHTYTFTVKHGGRHGLQISGLKNGFYVDVALYEVSSGECIINMYSATNNASQYATLTAGVEYRIVVSQDDGTGSYTLTLGQKKDRIDVTNYGTIYDSMEFANQVNNYTFVPEYTGTYRLDFSGVQNGFYLDVYVFDDLDYNIATGHDLSNENGLTVSLEANRTYHFQVECDSGLGDYAMTIGRQTPTKLISLGARITDSINFQDEKHYYSFTPTQSGTYKFTLLNMASSLRVTMYLFDSLGYQIGSCYSATNDDYISLQLNEGETYTLQTSWDSGLGNYILTLSY